MSAKGGSAFGGEKSQISRIHIDFALRTLPGMTKQDNSAAETLLEKNINMITSTIIFYNDLRISQKKKFLFFSEKVNLIIFINYYNTMNNNIEDNE